MVMRTPPFGGSPTDQAVKAWMARGPISPEDVLSYTVTRSGGRSEIVLTCLFEFEHVGEHAVEDEPAKVITPPPWRSLFDARFTVDGPLARALADRNDHPLDQWIRERTTETGMERWIVQALADAYPYGGAHRREVMRAFGDNAYGDFTAAQFDAGWRVVTSPEGSWSNVVTCLNFALDTWGAPGA